MAVDNKYGKIITEFGEIGEDEPVVVFRARDANLPMLLDIYHTICEYSGSPAHHLDLIDETSGLVGNWQEQNQDQVRVPNSDAYVKRTGRTDLGAEIG